MNIQVILVALVGLNMNKNFAVVIHFSVWITLTSALMEFTNPFLQWLNETGDWEMNSVEVSTYTTIFVALCLNFHSNFSSITQGLSTMYMYNFRCRTYIAKCFKHFNLHPDISSVAPHEFCNVSMKSFFVYIFADSRKHYLTCWFLSLKFISLLGNFSKWPCHRHRRDIS